ncbi:MAG TPA: NADH-quinone oxidoreductase subunit F [Euryarchaeota archaeon]|nr:NADH-quinone oxidoreductase subunit F [Euryarchaeota archaeon]
MRELVRERRIILENRSREGYDPRSIDDYIASGGYSALKSALERGSRWVVNEVSRSRLRGRGGAGFHTGFKWESVAMQRGRKKVLIANFDEGEEGTFKDRTIVESDPFKLIEGMTIAAYAMGIDKAFIYNRGEYPFFPPLFESLFEQARDKGLLGKGILGRDFDLEIEVVKGAGAYVCGESSAILRSIEGYAGQAQIKETRTAVSGLFSLPTCVNNVETLSNIPYIVLEGGENYASIGTRQSTGTRIVSLSGDVMRPGAYEVEMGKCTLGEIVEDLGGGVSGKEIGCALIGGASGSLVPPHKLDMNYSMEDAEKRGLTLGSGVIVIFNESRCPVDLAYNLSGFFAHESCGKCTPCRTGTHHIMRVLSNLRGGKGDEKELKKALDIASVMDRASICGLGKTASTPFRSLMMNFEEVVDLHVRGECPRHVCPMGGGDR